MRIEIWEGDITRLGVDAIAFPAISTGIYGYPLREAADTAIATIAEVLAAQELPRKVILCTFDALATQVTTAALDVFRATQPR